MTKIFRRSPWKIRNSLPSKILSQNSGRLICLGGQLTRIVEYQVEPKPLLSNLEHAGGAHNLVYPCTRYELLLIALGLSPTYFRSASVYLITKISNIRSKFTSPWFAINKYVYDLLDLACWDTGANKARTACPFQIWKMVTGKGVNFCLYLWNMKFCIMAQRYRTFQID